MKAMLVATVVAAMGFAGPRQAAAQQPRGFIMFGISSDVNDQHFPGIGGGVLFDLAKSWVSVGGQGDIFFSNGYVAGRGGPIAQANLTRHRAFRPFAIGGFGWGEESGPMFGAGIDVASRGRIGFRASVQDYLQQVGGFDCRVLGYSQSYCDANLHGGRPYTPHQPSVQLGIVWR